MTREQEDQYLISDLGVGHPILGVLGITGVQQQSEHVRCMPFRWSAAALGDDAVDEIAQTGKSRRQPTVGSGRYPGRCRMGREPALQDGVADVLEFVELGQRSGHVGTEKDPPDDARSQLSHLFANVHDGSRGGRSVPTLHQLLRLVNHDGGVVRRNAPRREHRSEETALTMPDLVLAGQHSVPERRTHLAIELVVLRVPIRLSQDLTDQFGRGHAVERHSPSGWTGVHPGDIADLAGCAQHRPEVVVAQFPDCSDDGSAPQRRDTILDFFGDHIAHDSHRVARIDTMSIVQADTEN